MKSDFSNNFIRVYFNLIKFRTTTAKDVVEYVRFFLIFFKASQ